MLCKALPYMLPGSGRDVHSKPGKVIGRAAPLPEKQIARESEVEDLACRWYSWGAALVGLGRLVPVLPLMGLSLPQLMLCGHLVCDPGMAVTKRPALSWIYSLGKGGIPARPLSCFASPSSTNLCWGDSCCGLSLGHEWGQVPTAQRCLWAAYTQLLGQQLPCLSKYPHFVLCHQNRAGKIPQVC